MEDMDWHKLFMASQNEAVSFPYRRDLSTIILNIHTNVIITWSELPGVMKVRGEINRDKITNAYALNDITAIINATAIGADIIFPTMVI